MNEVLRTRELIPPITARNGQGAVVRAWDYKQKRNLVIAFLHADCALCEMWLATLAARSGDISENEALGLVVYTAPPPRNTELLPDPLIAVADTTGLSHRAYLGPESFGSAGLNRLGVFVTDRYGELYEQWVVRDCAQLPPVREIQSALWRIQVAC